jgi:hypothetical protein
MAVTGAAVLAPELQPVADPFPILRIPITEERLTEATKDLGTMVRLPRDEFEQRVRAAGRMATLQREPPRIAEMRFTATPSGTNLAGEAEWTIQNKHGGPALLLLDPFRLAIDSPKWEDGSEAILGAFPSGSGILVPPGRHRLKFNWSAAATGTGNDPQFELRVPPCSAISLDLELPPGRTPTQPADALLTGPFPGTKDPAAKLWRFRFAERARLDFGIRRPGEVNDAAVQGSLLAKYDFAATHLAASFDWDLRATRGSVSEWVFAVPAGMAIADVIANDRAAWRHDVTAKLLHVALRQPAASGKVVIHATADRPPRGQSAPLPVIRPVNGIGSSERIELRVPPDLELERLDPADYALREATTAADGSRQLVLTGTLLPGGVALAYRRAPTVRLAGADAEFTTSESLDWRIEGDRVHLAARIVVRVRRGPLFRLAIRPPPAFAFDQLAAAPEESLGYTGAADGLIDVEFARPLAAGQRVDLQLDFRGPTLTGPAALAVPAVTPLGAAERDGWIALAPGRAWSVTPIPAPALEEAGEFDWPDDAPRTAADLFWYRGTDPSGQLLIAPVTPRFTVAVEDAGDATRLTLQPQAGQIAQLLVFEQSNVKRNWRAVRGTELAGVTHIERTNLPWLPPANPLATLLATVPQQVQEPASWWLLRFQKPSTGEIVLETTPKMGEGFIVLGADRVDYKFSPLPRDTLAKAWRFESLHLITRCSESSVLALFGGTVRSRGDNVLRIGLPAGAEVRAANVAGHWLSPSQCVLSRTGELALPLPQSAAPLRFEVRYRLPAASGTVRRVTSPVPVLPGEGHAVSRWWALPRGLLAAWPFTRGTADWNDLPAALDEPLNRPEDLTVVPATTDELTLVSARAAEIGGAVAAALLAALAWLGARSANRTLGGLLLILLVVTGAAFWLGPPAWEHAVFPIIIVAAVGSGAVAIARGWPRTATPPRMIVGGFASLLAVTAVIAQPATPRDPVFVLPGKERDVVVAPLALLEKLDQIKAKSGPGPVITAADYTGRTEESLARFTAVWTLQVFQPGETRLELPLADARLERATVNGQPAEPLAPRPDVYAIALPGPGRHTVEVRFAVPVSQTGADREVRCGLPDVPNSTLAFTAPATARQLQVVERLGAQSLTSSKETQELKAALGAVRTLHLRWREGAAAPGAAAALSVREAAIWDVTDAGHQLTAVYHVRIERGTVPSLRFDLPVELEPTRVAARSLDSLLVPTVLRDWSLGKETNGVRPLTLNLIAPLEGRLFVVLECEPRNAPTLQPKLHFPRPVGMTRTDAIYALRANGVAVESVGRGGVIDYAADVLFRDYGAIPDLRLKPGVPITAVSPRGNDLAELRPVLRPQAELPALTLATTWNLDEKTAAGRGTVQWSGAEPVAVLDFALNASVNEVRGAEVNSWAQTDGRVQVWLRKPAKTGSIEWLTASPIAGDSFDPPLPIPTAARITDQTLRVNPSPGWGVRIERTKGWTAMATAERGWFWRGTGSLPAPLVKLDPPQEARARGFALLEGNATEVVYRAALELPVAANRATHLVVSAEGLPKGATANLDVPPGTVVHPASAADGARAWDLDAPPGPAGKFHATLTITLPAKSDLTLPAIDFRTGNERPRERGVITGMGVTGGFEALSIDGLQPASAQDRAAIQAAWPGEAERLRRSGGEIRLMPTGTATLHIAASAPPPRAAREPAAKPEPETPSVRSPSTTPVITAFAWCAAACGVLVLFLRLPLTTWPEQVGLLAALAGFAAFGTITPGLVIYFVARGVWIFRMASRR